FLPILIVAQEYTINGFIKDKTTGEILIGANVFNIKKQNGTASNNFGFYSYTTQEDSIILSVSYIGYATELIALYLNKNIELNIELIPGDILGEIVVTGEQNIEEVTQMSRVSVPVQQIKSMPRLLGEVDVMKALQMIPGVQSGAEGTSGLYVRGGGPDQNLILLDGVPVYNASHLFGFFSVFNADAINNVDLIKGGFPARYGGRLSSVIDISLKEGNTEKIKGEGSIGIISSKLTVDGPIDDRTTFLVSGRRTYIDLLTRPIIRAESGGDDVAGYYFYDLNAKINHRFSNKDRVYLSTYLGNDKAYSRSKEENRFPEMDNEGQVYSVDREQEQDFELKWGNITTALRWNHVYSPRMFGNVTLTYSRYLFDVHENIYEYEARPDSVFEEDSRLRYFSGINDLGAKVDFQFNPNPNHSIRYGGSFTIHEFNPGALAYNSNIESDTTLGQDRVNANEFFIYAEDDFKIGEVLSLNIGLHASGFTVENEFYNSLEPRLAFNYRLPFEFSLKGSYTRMTQYIHLLTNSGIGLPTDLWVPSTNEVEPQVAYQYALGIAKNYEDLEVTLEGYYKSMDNLIEYEEGATYLSLEENWQDKVVFGKGESYGVELFLQKKKGEWNGWLGYTLSWNFREFDDVNFGEKFPYRYDRRHDVSLVLIHSPKSGVEYSMGWVYGTGNSVSVPVSQYPGERDNPWGLEFITLDYYDGRNGFRMPAYHRLDLNASWTKPKKWGERTWSIGAYNAYNRKNPFYLDIVEQYSEERGPEKKFIQYSLFPIIPSITYSFKFK
ncbi:MAG: TonB-dependent receptor, partial [Balneolales bacterium]|nr:TonB-dependent receptor [Balneolales bacterium]